MPGSSYELSCVDDIPSPSLIVFRDVLVRNIERMMGISGDVTRLRPHCKTHKMQAVIQMQVDRGITRHKCATIAELEMLVDAGADDILLAYPLVGPNIRRVVELLGRCPDLRLTVTVDHADPADRLNRALEDAGLVARVLLDIDTGQRRTGMVIGPEAAAFYRRLSGMAGLQVVGLHAYDGQNHQTDVSERRSAVDQMWQEVVRFRDQLERNGLQVRQIVAGGTGSFPMLAERDDPALELSPGTCVLFDAGYRHAFPDLPFEPAALLLTRVVSRPAARRVTLDAGNKSVASDPLIEERLVFPTVPDASIVIHNEEHLVMETEHADRFVPGDWMLAIPWHICPTSALHQDVAVVVDGRLVERWPVTARDRRLTV